MSYSLNWRKKIKNNKLVVNFYSIALALIIGVLTGLGAVGFRKLIDFYQEMYFIQGEHLLAFFGQYYIILIPMAGGLIVGPLTYFFAREARGHGVPEVMAAVAVRDGIIRPRVVLVKTLASAICIGSGGSVGQIGPLVQIGSAIGSTMGQLLHVPTRKMKALVACGAAGGIAATFNAPIGGMLFALEVILGDFTGSHMMLVIISAVSSSVVGRILLGDSPAIAVPAYQLNHPMELLLYGLLGIICGIISVLFIKVLYGFEDIFKSIKGVPEYFKPVLGGFLIGCIGLYFPQIFGVGYESIELAIAGKIVLATTAALVLLKLLATSITIGSGGSGGLFAPGLFIGSMLGATMGYIFNFMFPDTVITPAAYALVGMGGVLAGSAHAPMTAIVMIFEMSNNYQIILPLAIACVISSVVAKSINNENIYAAKLLRRGLDIECARKPDILKNVLVKDVMTLQIESLPGKLTVQEALHHISGSPHRGFPILSGEGLVQGIITRDELEKAAAGTGKTKYLFEFSREQLVTVSPYEPISVAAKKMDEFNVGRLLVVDPENNKKIIGLLSRTDIVSAYSRGLLVGELEESFVYGHTKNHSG